MNFRIACLVIAHERRAALVREHVVPSTVAQGFDDVLVVGDWLDDTPWPTGVRYLCVEPLTRTTTDALIKRDVGALATDATTLVYLSDDHALAPHFVAELRDVLNEVPRTWDVIVPNRYTMRADARIPLPNGEAEGYCAGHGMIVRRGVIEHTPWSAQRHHRNWDVLASLAQQRAGARFVWHPREAIAICDIEPGATPWR